jgi:hypothetical protein
LPPSTDISSTVGSSFLPRGSSWASKVRASAEKAGLASGWATGDGGNSTASGAADGFGDMLVSPDAGKIREMAVIHSSYMCVKDWSVLNNVLFASFATAG